MAVSASSTPGSAYPGTRRRKILFSGLQEHLTGYLFILPAVLLVALFGLFPIGYAFYMSLRRWRVRDRGFIGLSNYEKALGDWSGAGLFFIGFVILVGAYFLWSKYFSETSRQGLTAKVVSLAVAIVGIGAIGYGWGRMIAAGDDRFLNSLPVTFYYALGTVPIQIAIALVLAYLLFQKIKGQEFFRMIFFLPYVTPAIATAFVFRNIFSPRETSIANGVLERLGFEPQRCF